MSLEHARAFVEQLEQDPALRQAAAKAGVSHFAESLIALGAQRGLSFSESELSTVCNEGAAVKSGELGDADLDQVAGGVPMVTTLFQRISMIMEKYDNTAKSVIQSMRG